MFEYCDTVDDMTTPRRRAGIAEYTVSGELILCVEESGGAEAAGKAIALNGSGRAIWELCDGERSVGDILAAVAARFPENGGELNADVIFALSRFEQLGLIELEGTALADCPNVKFVIGIEDREEFYWQTAIFLESISGKLPTGWSVLVVVCNDHAPISDELRHILKTYGLAPLTGANYSKTDSFGFAFPGHTYGPLNRVEALAVVADHVKRDDLICLLDTDIFLYRGINFDVMPKGNAMAKSWHIEKEIFFSSVTDGAGVDLEALLNSFGCSGGYQGGGVNVFLKGSVLKQEKYIQDCFRFTQILYLLGRIAGIDNVWMSEMPCFSLALTANNIPYDLLDVKELAVSDGFEESIPPGTFYHYYSDPADPGGCGAFKDSKWNKQVYRQVNFLRTDFKQFIEDATSDHERYFFQLASQAKEKLYGSNAKAH